MRNAAQISDKPYSFTLSVVGFKLFVIILFVITHVLSLSKSYFRTEKEKSAFPEHIVIDFGSVKAGHSDRRIIQRGYQVAADGTLEHKVIEAVIFHHISSCVFLLTAGKLSGDLKSASQPPR